ncbi:MAG TPA: hypothetical protein VKN99_12810 [Polyangia bacterium]|nr:hypothetical protein [Polyangia bacterium]
MRSSTYSRILALGGLVVLGGLGCDANRSGWPDVAEQVPADEVQDDPSHPIAARYWAEIDPVAATMDLYRLHPGNIIYRNERIAEVRYGYAGNSATSTSCGGGGNCLPGSGTLNLFTDPTKLTFVDANGQCHSNNGSCTGTGGHAPPPVDNCANVNTFCSPLQIVSNMTFGQSVGAMPDVVTLVGQAAGQANQINSCADFSGSQVTAGQAGQCFLTGPAKVDASTSDLTSSIGSGSTGCSYCYGNAINASNGGLPALADAVLSSDTNPPNATLKGLFTDTLIMNLANSNAFSVTLTVRWSSPTLDTPGSQIQLIDPNTGSPPNPLCATPGSTLAIVTGGAFGPPGSCLNTTQPPTTCDPFTDGTPGANYTVSFTGVGSPVTPTFWSDTEVDVTVPMGATSGRITINTPLGSVGSTDTYTVCTGGGNTWRRLTSNLPAGVVQPAGGVIGQTIYVAGGRTAISSATSAVATVRALPIPTMATPNPSWTTAASMTTAVWGAAYTVAGGSLYVIGGATGALCTNATQIFNGTSWSSGPNLPLSLCDATAVTLGSVIVVSGGSTRPSPLAGAPLSSTQRAWTLDTSVGGAMWTAFTTGSNIDPTNRWGGGGDSNGSTGLIVGGANFVGSGAPISAASSVTQSGGTPTFASATAAPAALCMGRVADTGGFAFLYGGISGTSCGATSAGTSTLYQIAANGSGSWTTLSPGGDAPAARFGGVLLAATPSGGTTKLYSIAGAASNAFVTAVDEYTP